MLKMLKNDQKGKFKSEISIFDPFYKAILITVELMHFENNEIFLHLKRFPYLIIIGSFSERGM